MDPRRTAEPVGVAVGLSAAGITIALGATVPLLLTAPASGPTEGAPRSPRAGAAAPVAADTAVHSATRILGRSVRGRPIIAYHRWRPGARNRVLVIGSMHGDEQAGLAVVRRLRAVAPPAGVDLWLIPTVNPDGNAARARRNARAVDLNRNFPHVWARTARGTHTYSGPRASSEPETRLLMRFVSRYRPRTTVVFHQPLYGVDSYRAKSPALVRALSRGTGLPVRSFSCRRVCRGTFTGWHNRTTPGRAVTVEFGRSASPVLINRTAAAVLRSASVR
jgi:murein peptide amidase A